MWWGLLRRDLDELHCDGPPACLLVACSRVSKKQGWFSCSVVQALWWWYKNHHRNASRWCDLVLYSCYKTPMCYGLSRSMLVGAMDICDVLFQAIFLVCSKMMSTTHNQSICFLYYFLWLYISLCRIIVKRFAGLHFHLFVVELVSLAVKVVIGWITLNCTCTATAIVIFCIIEWTLGLDLRWI